MVCACMCVTTTANVNADTVVTATDTVVVLVLDPRYQCTLVPILVPVFEQYGTFVLHYFLPIPYFLFHIKFLFLRKCGAITLNTVGLCLVDLHVVLWTVIPVT